MPNVGTTPSILEYGLMHVGMGVWVRVSHYPATYIFSYVGKYTDYTGPVSDHPSLDEHYRK